ncbi:hypothetical protein CCMA1212_001952 [Trichoderma ghanense]|uniref:Uncharacterized protein n=1 Tax=Trichoderma ghanense TaxID=65468 RepID=A0ABY2HHH0_9HYPO
MVSVPGYRPHRYLTVAAAAARVNEGGLAPNKSGGSAPSTDPPPAQTRHTQSPPKGKLAQSKASPTASTVASSSLSLLFPRSHSLFAVFFFSSSFKLPSSSFPSAHSAAFVAAASWTTFDPDPLLSTLGLFLFLFSCPFNPPISHPPALGSPVSKQASPARLAAAAPTALILPPPGQSAACPTTSCSVCASASLPSILVVSALRAPPHDDTLILLLCGSRASAGHKQPPPTPLSFPLHSFPPPRYSILPLLDPPPPLPAVPSATSLPRLARLGGPFESHKPILRHHHEARLASIVHLRHFPPP